MLLEKRTGNFMEDICTSKKNLQDKTILDVDTWLRTSRTAHTASEHGDAGRFLGWRRTKKLCRVDR
ncbi:MAG: hypothetical protein ACLSHV_03435 [Hominisplanchenecus sp.]